ncbi:MAG: oxidoreductase [Chelatococcus sp.]|nr:MAG: oxidoreductase [Chelatococcus sp.]
MSARLIMKLRVAEARFVTNDTLLLRFVHASRPQLPAWTAGAHIDLLLPDGKIRQYSLCGNPAERDSYTIAVKREAAGRGGSAWIHENLAEGAPANVSAPRNNFGLAEGAAHHLLMAGGIGVTPILAMARELEAGDAPYSVHYCAPRATAAPLLEELRRVCGARLTTWFSAEGQRLSPVALDALPDGTHLYACGPLGLIDDLTRHALGRGWLPEQIHAEKFQALLDENFVPEDFEVELSSTGQRLHVPASATLLSVLQAHGVSIRTSCETGLCGSCICEYAEGDVIHRDAVLQIAERAHRIVPCVSRARGTLSLAL